MRGGPGAELAREGRVNVSRMKASGGKLTPKRARFVEEYLIDLNATQAAIRAGYSERTAYSQGQRLLKDVDVASALTQARTARSKRTEITQDMVLKELGKIAFGDQRGVMGWGADGVTLRESSELTDDEAAMVAEVAETKTKDGGSIRLKTNDKVGALQLVGKHLGMFADRLKVEQVAGEDEKRIMGLLETMARKAGLA